jgi:hypothetical protein
MSTDLTSEKLAELEALAEAATPGPWEDHVVAYAQGDPSNGPSYDVSIRCALGQIAHLSEDGDAGHGANAAFIAAANPATVLALVRAVREMRTALERAKCPICRNRGTLICMCEGQSCSRDCSSGKPCDFDWCVERRKALALVPGGEQEVSDE